MATLMDDVKTINIEKLIPNEDNPRFIRDADYEKLLYSIQSFPSMRILRKVIVDEDMVIQGGNMRYKACQELGITEVPYDIYTQEMYEMDCAARKALAKKEKKKYKKPTYKEMCKEFVIKDNVSYGSWDWDILTKGWDEQQLEAFGMPILKHDWSNLDFIEGHQQPPVLGKNKIIVIVPTPLIGDIGTIEDGIRDFLNKNFGGCEIK